MAIEAQHPQQMHFYHDVELLRNPEDVLARIRQIDSHIRSGQVAECEIARDMFADTTNGQKYFQWVAGGSPCEAWVNQGEGEKNCGKPSIVALEFDLPLSFALGPTAEVVLVCSLEHMEQAREKISQDMVSQGKDTVFGINGWGRE